MSRQPSLPALRTQLTLLAMISAHAAAGLATGQGQGPPPASVQCDKVKREPVQERRLVTGELRAVRRSQVATQEQGAIVEISVSEGMSVEAGAILARLDDRRLAVAKRGLEADLAAVAALIEERQATLDWRQRDYDAYSASFEKGAANPRELRDAESGLNVAKARKNQAQRQHEVIQARIDLVEERLRDMVITAPFDGVIVAKRTELGEWVSEGDPVVELVSRGPVEAWLEIPQRHFKAVASRASGADLTVEIGERTASVDSVRVIPQVDLKARSFYAVAVLPESSDMTPGMSIRAWVPTEASVERITVPRDAILRNEIGPYVYIARQMSADGPAVAMVTSVIVLFPWGDRFVVESPELRPGDLVVVEGNERLFPMAPIFPRIVPESQADDASGLEDRPS